MKKKIVSCSFLPTDVIERAMSYLDLSSQASTSRICKDWQEVDLRESLGLPRSFAFKDSKVTLLGWIKKHPIRYMSMLGTPELNPVAEKLIRYHHIPEKTLSSHLQAITATKEYAPLAKIIPSDNAFVAVLDNGQCVAWGNPDWTGTTPVIPEGRSIRSACSNPYAFVAVLDNGQCVAWGTPHWGGTAPVIPADRSIRSVHSNGNAFVAVLDNGQCVAWGNPDRGGTRPVTLGHIAVWE